MPVPANMTLVFADDFASGTWSNGKFNGWKPTLNWGGVGARTLPQNGDRQCYYDPSFNGLGINPLIAASSILSLTANTLASNQKPQSFYRDYSSGLLSSSGLFSQTYGYFELRAQLPKGKGLRAEFSLMAENDTWPPEIKVMEVLGDNTTRAYVGAVSSPPVTPDTSTRHLYVSTTGNDSAAGTQAAPYKTINKALSVATAGTTVHVANGTYVGQVYNNTCNGTAQAPIKIVADTKWGAKIVPGSGDTQQYAFAIGDGASGAGSYVYIDGIEVDGTNHAGGQRWFFGIYVLGEGSKVLNCKVHDIARYAGATNGSNGGAGICTDGWYGDGNMDVIGCVVYRCGRTDGRSTTLGHGIYPTQAGGNIVNNLVYNCAADGITGWHDVRNINVMNNTVVGCAGAGIVVGGGGYYHYPPGALGYYVANNIVFDNYNGIEEGGDIGAGNVYTHNLVFGNTNNWSLINSTHSNTISANPAFVNYQRDGGDYHLTASSPAINAGTVNKTPFLDVEGKYRGQGSQGATYDLGCFEYSSNAAITPARAPTTVLPQQVTVSDLSVGYHTFAVDWREDFITYYIDDVQVFREATPANCKVPMFMQVNLGVGSNKTGFPDGTTTFPASMKIDYIRAYAMSTGPVTRNVKTQYGAKGDGITDDWSAIQAAIDAAQEGDQIYFPATTGRYLHSKHFTFTRSNVTVYGDGIGSALQATSKTASALMFNTTSGVTVKDLKLIGAMADQDADLSADPMASGIYMYNSTGYTLKNLTISKFCHAGTLHWGSDHGVVDSCTISENSHDSVMITAGSHHITVQNNTITQSGGDGISVLGYEAFSITPNNITITNNTVTNQQSGRNLAVIGGDTVIITDNTLSGSPGQACLYLASEAGSNATRAVEHISVQRNIIKLGGDAIGGTGSGHGLVTIFSNTARVNNNITITQNNLTDYDFVGVRIIGINNDTVTITNNNFSGDVSGGIQMTAAATNVITSPNTYGTTPGGQLPGESPPPPNPTEGLPMVDFIKSVTKNGRFIGRDYTELLDPNRENLVVCITGVGGPTQIGAALTSVNSNDFASTYAPWVADPKGVTLGLSSGTLQVTPTGQGYVGANYQVQSLEPGRTLTLRGKTKYVDAGNACAWIIWDMGNNLDAWSDLVNQDTYQFGIGVNTWYNFQVTTTVPASGNVQFGLLGAKVGQNVYFDDVVVESQGGGINFNVLKYNDFTSTYLPWTADSAALSLQSGSLLVTPDTAYKGAVYDRTDLTPGDTITVRGKYSSPNGGAAAVHVWNTTPSTWVDLGHTETFNATPTDFFVTFTVPTGGSVRFALQSSLAGKPALFDNVEINKGNISPTQGVAKDSLGNPLIWTGNILTSTAHVRGYAASLLPQGGHVKVNLPAMSGDFLFEGSVYVPSSGTGNRGVFMTDTNSMAFGLLPSGNWYFWDGTATQDTGVAASTAGKFVDWRISRTLGMVSLLIDGAVIYSQAFTTNFDADAVLLGIAGSSKNEPWGSNIQEFRVYKDIGTRAAYTPNTRPYIERLGRYTRGVWSV